MKFRVSRKTFLAITTALTLSGCGTHQPGDPVPQPPAIDVAEAIDKLCPAIVTNPQLFEDAKRTCKSSSRTQVIYCVIRVCQNLSTPTPRPAPRVTPEEVTPEPHATVTATAAPTAAPTASPAVPAWDVRLKFYEGFHGCNPAPCNTLDNVTVVRVDANGKTHTCAELYPARSRCEGDRTPMCEMPGFDYPGLPKATGCTELPYCLAMAEPARGACIQNCMIHDSPGTPCGGAAACDLDHLICPRTFVGCQGKPRGDVNGSKLTWTGLTGCVEHANHYGFACTGMPGARYSLCTEPLPGARNEDGSPLLGGQKRCKEGWF